MQTQYAYFSAAIRDGAKVRPQAFGNIGEQATGSCAIAAGVEAMTGRQACLQLSPYSLTAQAYPYLRQKMNCPVCGPDPLVPDLQCVLWCLNDTHQWTREQIAAWLYEVEESIGFVTLTEEASQRVIQHTNDHQEVAISVAI